MEKFFLNLRKISGFQVTTVLLSVFFLVACNNQEVPATGIDSYTYVSGTFTQQDTTAVAGTGVIRFNSNLPGVTSNKSVEIAGSLSPSGSVAVIFNSDDMTLAGSRGVIFKLARDGSNGTVTAQIAVNGYAVGVQPLLLNSILPGDFDLIIQVYNSAVGTRVLVWRKDVLTYSLTNTLVDSSNPTHLTSTYPSAFGGPGIFMGLQIVEARLTTTIAGDPKVSLP